MWLHIKYESSKNSNDKADISRLDKKARPNYMIPTRSYFKYKETSNLKAWKKRFHANTNQKKKKKKAGLSILISG